MTSIAFPLYLFLLVFSPPALGRAQFWSLSMFEIVSFTALCLLMLNRHRHCAPLVRVPGLLPLLLFRRLWIVSTDSIAHRHGGADFAYELSVPPADLGTRSANGVDPTEFKYPGQPSPNCFDNAHILHFTWFPFRCWPTNDT